MNTGKQYQETKKLFFLNLVHEKKDLLFGKFSASLTDKDKQIAWQDILAKCNTAGYEFVTESAKVPWKYLRDTVWASNLKKRTLVSE